MQIYSMNLIYYTILCYIKQATIYLFSVNRLKFIALFHIILGENKNHFKQHGKKLLCTKIYTYIKYYKEKPCLFRLLWQKSGLLFVKKKARWFMAIFRNG